MAKRQLGALVHGSKALRVLFLCLIVSPQPSLRSECVSVITKDTGVTGDNTWIDADLGLCGDEAAIRKLKAVFGNLSLEHQANSRGDAHRLSHDSFKVRQLANLLPLWDRERQVGRLNLVNKLLVYSRVLDDVIGHRTHSTSRRVTTSQDVEHQPVDDLVVVDKVMCVFETVVLVNEQVDRLSLGRTRSNLLLIYGEDLDSVQEAIHKGPGTNSPDGVLIQPLIKPRDLADGSEILETGSALGDDTLDIATFFHEAVMPTKADIGGGIPSIVSDPIIHLTDTTRTGKTSVQMADELIEGLVHDGLEVEDLGEGPEASDWLGVLGVEGLVCSVEDVLDPLAVDDEVIGAVHVALLMSTTLHYW